MTTTALRVLTRLQQAGHTTYFAGGCVRDHLRGVPASDVDIASSATPAQVQQLFAKTVAVGAQFGVVIVTEQGESFEVARFRSDGGYHDGRHPSSVRYGTPVEDAQRRDFTINGMFYDPTTDTILDHVGGRADLAAGLLRAIGNPRDRFAEDKLRLLRAVRLATTLDLQIEPATWTAIRAAAAQISVVSPERIRDELVKILTGPQAGRGLTLLDESGLLEVVLPEIAAMKGVEQPPQFHPEGDVFEHVTLMLGQMADGKDAQSAAGLDRTVLALAVLLHDVGKPATFERAPDRIRFHNHDRVGAPVAVEILRRLRFSNKTVERVVTCVAEHMRLRHVQEMRPAKLKAILARDTFGEELELHRLDCLASHGSLANYEFLQRLVREWPPAAIAPPPLVTGNDLLAMGLPPGPRMGELLRAIAELQLNEELPSREAALAYLRPLVGSPPPDPAV